MHNDDKFTAIAVAGSLVVTVGIFLASQLGPGSFSRESEQSQVEISTSVPESEIVPTRLEPVPIKHNDSSSEPTSAPVEGIVPAVSSDTAMPQRAEYEQLIGTIANFAQLRTVGFGEIPKLEEILVRTDRDGRTVVAEGTHRRYAGLVQAFESLDPETVADILDEADTESRAAFSHTIGELLATPVPQVAPDMRSRGWYWGFADEDYHQLSMAQKHLLLMGRDNARIVRVKLEALARAAGIAEESPKALEPLDMPIQIADARDANGQHGTIIAP